jgi:hypothetical protein
MAMSELIRLRAGVWVRPDTVVSIAAHGETEEFGKTIKARVDMRTTTGGVTWTFETYAIAVAFADDLAERLLNPEKREEVKPVSA